MLVLALVLAVAGASTASGAESGVVASGNGDYGFTGTAVGSVFVIGPFTWNVQQKEDGSVRGAYEYTQVRDGVSLSVSGSLHCATFIGDRLWVGGVIEESSRASLVGLDMWFQVQDNGEGANAAPDMSSTVGAGAPGTAQQYCNDHPPVMFPFLVGSGNLQVRS